MDSIVKEESSTKVRVWQSESDAYIDDAVLRAQACVRMTVIEKTTYEVLNSDDHPCPETISEHRTVDRTLDLSLFLDDTASFESILLDDLDRLGVPTEPLREVVGRVADVGRSAAAQWPKEGRRGRAPLIHALVKLKTYQWILFEYEDDDDDADAYDLAEAAGLGLKRVRVVDAHHDQRDIETTTCTRSCVICFEEDISAGSTVAMTPCSHVFHEKCIVPWLKQAHNCPLCRFDVVPHPKRRRLTFWEL